MIHEYSAPRRLFFRKSFFIFKGMLLLIMTLSPSSAKDYLDSDVLPLDGRWRFQLAPGTPSGTETLP